MKLDQFINEKKQLDFTLKGVVYTADITARNILKLVELSEEGKQADAEKVFEVVFGKEDAEVLLREVNIAGITKISDAITEAITVNSSEEQNAEEKK